MSRTWHTLLLFFILPLLALGFPEPILHEQSQFAAGRGARIDGDAVLPVRIALTQANLDRGYEYLMDVAHPASPNYGKLWTSEAVQSAFAPTKESTELVTRWLTSSGVSADSISSDKGWLAFDLSSREFESLFHAEMYEYGSADGTIKIGCEAYYLPQEVAPHVDFVTPDVALALVVKRAKLKLNPAFLPGESRQSGGESLTTRDTPPQPPQYGNIPTHLQHCATNITPPCIRALYGIPVPHEAAPDNALGIFNFNDSWVQSDLDSFFAKYAPRIPDGTHPIEISINNGTAPVDAGSPFNMGEADVDVQVGLAFVWPNHVVHYEAGPDEPSSADLTFLNPFLDAVDSSFCTAPDRESGFQCTNLPLTKVVSTSITAGEIGYPVSILRRTCNEYMKLSLQGHTFVFDSGDWGVGQNPSSLEANGCIRRDGPDSFYTSSPNAKIFNPQFPDTCPYVLSVGGTQVNANETILGPETAMNVPGLSPFPNAIFSSGGGFSNYFRRPNYQKAAVDAYLAENDPGYAYYNPSGRNGSNIGANKGIHSRHGRAFPDVSANGANFMAFFDGTDRGFHGTSLSTPIWASIITLLNGERSKIGKGPVGFINAALYEHPEVFQDITTGKNPGCGTEGFQAAKGWDPVTGFGTPNYPKLRELFLSLP